MMVLPTKFCLEHKWYQGLYGLATVNQDDEGLYEIYWSDGDKTCRTSEIVEKLVSGGVWVILTDKPAEPADTKDNIKYLLNTVVNLMNTLDTSAEERLFDIAEQYGFTLDIKTTDYYELKENK